MKKTAFILMSFTTVWFFGCKEEGHVILHTSSVTHEDFTVTQKLSGISLQHISDSLFIPVLLFIENDYLFISELTTDHIMHIVKVPDDEYLGLRGKRGTGPGELLNSWKFLSADKGKIGVFDSELGKVAFYSIDTLLSENRHVSEFLHREMVNSNGSIIIENDVYFLSRWDNPEARFYSFDLGVPDEGLRKLGEFPRLNKPYPNFSPDDERQVISHAKLSHKENLLVLSYYSIPLVEIYNLEKDWHVSISGPDPLPSPDGFGNIRYYSSSCISDKFIYLLYVEDKTERKNTSSTVLILDLEGNPVRKVLLDREIFRLAVYEDRYIYGIIQDNEGSDFSLVKFPIE